MNGGKDQIRGWKDIASYFDRDERTVKRWERQRNLPVRRIPGPGRANVYILVSELEAWLAAGNLSAAHLEHENAVDDKGTVAPGLNQVAPPRSHPLGLAPEDAELLSASGPSAGPRINREKLLASPATRANNMRRLWLVVILGVILLPLGAGLARGRLFGRRGKSIPTGSLPARAVSHATQTRADALYFEGIYFKEQRTPASLDHALHTFEQVVAQDPRHARAYAGLATTYLLMREYGSMPQAEAYARAEAAAERAVALDPQLADAHAALGFIAFFSSWDPRRATREFESALQLDPFSTVAHHWYGSMLTHQGLYPEALEQLNIAQQLEPTSAAIVSSKAFALGLSGHREDAIAMLQPLVTGDRDPPSPHRTIAALSLMEPRDIRRYLDESERFAELRNDRDSLNRLKLASDAYQRQGEVAMWAVMLQNERTLHPSAQHPTYFMIDAEAALGEQEAAMRDMHILAQAHNFDMIGIGIDPLLDPLHHNPNFKRIEAVVGLQPVT